MCGACGTGRSAAPWESALLRTAVEYRMLADALSGELRSDGIRVRALPGRILQLRSAGGSVRIVGTVNELIALRGSGAPTGEDSPSHCIDLSGSLGTPEARVALVTDIVVLAPVLEAPVVIAVDGEVACYTVGPGGVEVGAPTTSMEVEAARSLREALALVQTRRPEPARAG